MLYTLWFSQKAADTIGFNTALVLGVPVNYTGMTNADSETYLWEDRKLVATVEGVPEIIHCGIDGQDIFRKKQEYMVLFVGKSIPDKLKLDSL